MAANLEISNEAPQSVESMESYEQSMIDKAAQEGVQTEPHGDIPVGQHKQDEPQVDDKFGGDYNKLKQSYDELQRKLGSQSEVETPVEDLSIPQDPEPSEAPFNIQELTESYMKNGGLSDAEYKQLENGGVSRELADSYIAGQRALGMQIGNEVKSSVGGDEAYGNMVEWAKSNYSEAQIAAYDQAVNSGNIENAKLAAKGLLSDYHNANGQEGITYGGKQAAPEGAGDVFRSNAEVTLAMKDPRYETDMAYQADVRDKLARSDIFGTKTV